ncbi:hypothetical protein F2Q68_00005466 [Brassica cretica]|uniref:Rx N-terminal domain-containing protein n=1 Tax=Brassica cretica TaxID=69181 RepID=A0A8S9JE22_BRACR|nr:hypothetical protein F2Q68_00005466 [Brassica cretica]
MVAAITGFVVAKMGNYLIDEISMLIGVKDDLEELKTELTCIQDIAYDVEDVLDCYNLKTVQRSQRRGLMRLIKIFGETMDSYRITDDIGSLKRRISDVTRKRETYGIGNFNECRGRI